MGGGGSRRQGQAQSHPVLWGGLVTLRSGLGGAMMECDLGRWQPGHAPRDKMGAGGRNWMVWGQFVFCC